MMESIGIVGAGTMGNGIAQVCAAAGLHVVMVDISDAAVTRGMSVVAGSLDRLLKKEKMTDADKEAALKRIEGTTLRSSPPAISSSRRRPRTRSSRSRS